MQIGVTSHVFNMLLRFIHEYEGRMRIYLKDELLEGKVNEVTIQKKGKKRRKNKASKQLGSRYCINQ